MNLFLYCFLFFLPAGIANIVPVLVAKIPGLKVWNYPLDFGKKFRGKRILGGHKTIRGMALGVLFGMFVAFLLRQTLLVGFLLSFGALFGDSVKSFFKRQIGIPSGKSWFPFDQIDYIVGGIIFSFFALQLTFIFYLIIFVMYFFLHLGVTYIGFLLKFKNDPL